MTHDCPVCGQKCDCSSFDPEIPDPNDCEHCAEPWDEEEFPDSEFTDLPDFE